MGMLRPWHIIVLVIVILLLFGARRLPDLARSVGQSLKIFKSEVKDLTDDGKSNDSSGQPTEAPQPKVTPPTTGVTPGGDASAASHSADPDAPKA
jgi:sec-independent protein translocase protein TatA